MARLDAAYDFWKQSRQADATLQQRQLQQQQLMLGSGGEETVAITTTTSTSASYPPEEQTQLQQPLPDDEQNFQAEECKINALSQTIAIDEDGECDSEVEAITGEAPLQAVSAQVCSILGAKMAYRPRGFGLVERCMKQLNWIHRKFTDTGSTSNSDLNRVL